MTSRINQFGSEADREVQQALPSNILEKEHQRLTERYQEITRELADNYKAILSAGR
jgi:hypothetical protein